MRMLPAVAGLMLLASPLYAEAPVAAPKAVVTPMLSTTMTSSGQPIVLPQKDAQITVSTYDIPPGAVLPKHKHPFPRFGIVQAGTITVTNFDTGKSEIFKAGDVIVEAVDQWHSGATVGAEPVKLLVIDMVEKGKGNVVLSK